MASSTPANKLFFGDNLKVMREEFDPETVDLVYLDPPFNSNRDYNLLFKSPKGQQSEAQITAFEDTWHWASGGDSQAEREFDDLRTQPNTQVTEIMMALRSFLGENDMMAYLTMMATRLLELHRILKPTGSLYLHCDPTASHYLKIVLDGVFGKENFVNEIVWKRTGAHSASKGWNPVHDTIFFYKKSEQFVWNELVLPHTDGYSARYRNVEPDGRIWADDNLTAPGTRGGDSGADWRGHNPTSKGSHWKVSAKAVEALIGKEEAAKLSTTQKLDVLADNGLIYWPKNGAGFPRFKRVLSDGSRAQDWIGDIAPVNSQAQERLGYPTQKPLALLERIIESSSNPGDVILDPFCGCGTAVHAAQKLKRKWIGIDITCLAITLIEKRINDAFPEGADFEVVGLPEDIESATDLAGRDKYQFQYWAIRQIPGALPSQGKKKGADGGIDGVRYFFDFPDTEARKIVISVKGGKLKADDVRSLMAVRTREKADFAFLVSLAEPTVKMRREAATAGFFEWRDMELKPTGKKSQRVQLFSIPALLSGKHTPDFPDFSPNVNYKKAKREVRKSAGHLFDGATDSVEPE